MPGIILGNGDSAKNKTGEKTTPLMWHTFYWAVLIDLLSQVCNKICYPKTWPLWPYSGNSEPLESCA